MWSFQSKKQGQPLIPELQEIEWAERVVVICFDSDAVTNPDVTAAELRLALRLTEAGARVYIARIPASEQVNVKLGIDDYIVLNGVEQFRDQVLEQAFESGASRVLHELNKKVLYVRNPGFIWDRDVDMRLSPSAFKEHAYSNLFMIETHTDKQGNESMKRVPAAKMWLEWPHRAETLGLTFAPGQPRITADNLLNTWEGWGVSEPIEGDVAMWHRLLDHIFGGQAEERKWFEAWCAYPLQHPGTKLHTAAAIWGVVHGSGKTLIGHTLMRIYGKHAAELKDKDLDDERNAWAENKQFVLADDITAKGDRQLMRRLMTMVTQKFMTIDIKYVPQFTLPDLINYYYTSNEPDALYLEDEDRRFWVFETYAPKMLWYNEYRDFIEDDSAIAALWHYFLSLDLAGFDPKAPAPMTIAKANMTHMGKSELGAWVRQLKDLPGKVLDLAGLKGDLFSAKELHALFDAAGDKKATPNALARELRRAGFYPPANGSPLRAGDGSMVNVYALRNTAHWREATWKEACEHYTGARALPGGKGASKVSAKKF